MAIRVVRLGSPRQESEGLRIGTVSRPPRGVPKGQYATRDWYDVWLQNLAPSAALRSALRSDLLNDEVSWRKFEKRYRAEMKRPDSSHVLDLLAALSHQTNFSVGCYCADEEHCHRSILRQLLHDRGATFVNDQTAAE